MLELHTVNKTYGSVAAVAGVSVVIRPRQFVGIIGRSGAGKSTLLRMINRLTDPNHGQISFEGTDITELKGGALYDWRSQCAMIFQQFNLVGRLDVLTNVMLGRLNRMNALTSMLRLFSDSDRIDALEALEWLGIVQTAGQQAGTLSGGQQQRVAIARALHQDPKMILADEPIASLDPMNAALVMDALKRIHEDKGITVICNLHTLDTARSYCDRILGMKDGSIVFDGPPSRLTADVTREIYGAGSEFNEASTSTTIRPAAGEAVYSADGASVPEPMVAS